MSDERARFRSLTTESRDGVDEKAQGLHARVTALLDALGPRDVAALARIVERDRSYGERVARNEPEPEPEPEPR